MNVFIKICILFVFIVVEVRAQSVTKVSLSQAVEIALKNVVELKNLELDEKIQALKNKEVVASTLPQVTGSAQGLYYTNRPVIQFPTSDISVYEVLEREGVKDASGQPINVSKASFGVQPVVFVAPLNFQFDLNVQQLIFQPDVFVAFQARQTVMDYAKQNVVVAQQKVKESVQKAYYSVLIAENQAVVLQETKKRLDQLLVEMQQMYKNGFAEKLDIDKLQVTINNTTTAQNQLENGLNISRSLLKNAMGLPQKDSLVLTDDLNPSQLQAEMLVAKKTFDYSQRSEYGLLNIAERLQALDIKRQKLGYLPTVAAFYQLQRAGQRNEIFSVNGSSPWFWFTTGLVGLTINQPIFDGNQRKHKIAQSKLAMDKIVNSREELKGFIDLEQNIAYQSIQNAMLNVEVQERNRNLAESVYTATKKKYQSGLGSSFELIQTDTELQRANGSYFQALYEAYIAKISYLKSLGQL